MFDGGEPDFEPVRPECVFGAKCSAMQGFAASWCSILGCRVWRSCSRAAEIRDKNALRGIRASRLVIVSEVPMTADGQT